MTNSEMIINQIDKMLENFGVTIARIKLGNAGYTEVEKQYLSVGEMEKDIDNINNIQPNEIADEFINSLT